jgi:hypothetical protein
MLNNRVNKEYINRLHNNINSASIVSEYIFKCITFVLHVLFTRSTTRVLLFLFYIMNSFDFEMLIHIMHCTQYRCVVDDKNI